jgi:uncharacterized membrane protein YhaH (DUF805 family)
VIVGWLLFAPVLPLGRMRRLAFFASYLIITAVALAVARFAGNQAVALLALAIFLWSQFCIHARRLHDIGGTAFWMLAPWFVAAACICFGALAVINGIIMLPPGQPTGANVPIAAMSGLGMVAGVFGLMVLVGFFLFLSLWPSSKKAKYGPPIGAPKTESTVA